MRIVFIGFCLVLACFWAGCGGASRPEGSGADSGLVSLPNNFFMRLHGTVAETKSSLVLLRSHGEVVGYFYNDYSRVPERLSGTVDGQGMFRLHELSDAGEPVTEWLGRFLQAGKFTGNVRILKTGPRVSFAFEEVPTNLKGLVAEHFREEACEHKLQGPFDLAAPRASWNDTLCPFIDVVLLHVETADSAVCARINQELKEEVYDDDSKNDSLQEFMMGIHALPAGQFSSMQYVYAFESLEKDVLTLRLTFTFDDGQAFPLTHITFLNFDLRSGRRIQLRDLFAVEALQQLTSRVEAFLIAHLPADRRQDYVLGAYALGEAFALTSEGMVFPVNVKAGDGGMVDWRYFLVAYAELRTLGKEGSVLGRFM